MILRRFKPEGIRAFQAFLAAARREPSSPPPWELLEDERLTEIVSSQLAVEPQSFQTKADAATYLAAVLSPIPAGEVARDAGLWTWLSLFYFDAVCPLQDQKRVVRNDYHYVFEPKNSRHFYRHLLFVSWRVLNIAPTHHRLILTTSISTLDQVTTEVMKRLFLTRIRCIFEVLDRLYWDKKRGKAKMRIVGPKIRSGDLTHRLPLRIRQLEKTYDLLVLNADQLLDLLGSEFQALDNVAASQRFTLSNSSA